MDKLEVRNIGLTKEDQENAQLYLDNYYGVTPVAKWVEGFVKTGVHDGEFIPWTVMDMAIKLLDWNSKVEFIENDAGGYVFRDTVITKTNQTDIDGIDTDTGAEIIRGKQTENTSYSFYIKVKVTYLGETTEHQYAVLSTAHAPVQFINSQMVNKAMQRGKARAISLVTGIGLALWTREEIEMELAVEAEGPKTIKPLKKEEKPKKLKKPQENDTIDSAIEKSLAEFLVEKVEDKEFVEKYKTSLQFIKDTYNVDYTEKDVDVLAEGLTKVNDIEGFANMIMREE